MTLTSGRYNRGMATEQPPRDDQTRKARYRDYLKGELKGAAQYAVLARLERDPERAEVFANLSKAEMRHAARWAEGLGVDAAFLKPSGGLGLWLFRLYARLIGTTRVMPMLLRGEAEDIRTYAADPEGLSIAKEERSHGRTLRRLAGITDSAESVRSESQHQTGAGGSLRAAVLGVNDGLISNFSLVMGVAGASGNPDFVLLAGLAGLLAGAFSMAAGEYVSMRSQREVYEHQIELERIEIEQWPEEEEAELVLLYQAKGIPREDARRIARQVMADPKAALDTLSREELGLDPAQLGYPVGAAASSFAAFAAGALVPILPYLADAGRLAFSLSAALTAGALALVGASLAFISGRNPVRGAVRMLLAGGAAAAVTFGLGHLVGDTILG